MNFPRIKRLTNMGWSDEGARIFEAFLRYEKVVLQLAHDRHSQIPLLAEREDIRKEIRDLTMRLK